MKENKDLCIKYESYLNVYGSSVYSLDLAGLREVTTSFRRKLLGLGAGYPNWINKYIVPNRIFELMFELRLERCFLNYLTVSNELFIDWFRKYSTKWDVKVLGIPVGMTSGDLKRLFMDYVPEVVDFSGYENLDLGELTDLICLVRKMGVRYIVLFDYVDYPWSLFYEQLKKKMPDMKDGGGIFGCFNMFV